MQQTLKYSLTEIALVTLSQVAIYGAQRSFSHPNRVRYDAQCMTIYGHDMFIYSGAFGLTPYTGDMDHLRVFTFDPLTDDPVAALTVPEPTTIGLLTLGALGLLRRRRVS